MKKIILAVTKIFFITAIVLSFSSSTKAQDNLGASLPKFGNPIDNPNISVRIPGFTAFRSIKCEETATGQDCFVPWLADYMKALYTYGIGVIVIFAIIVMMIGGVVWLTAGGNEEKISNAKGWVAGSLFGILIALSSYMILNIVNPALTELSPIKLASISKENLDVLQQLPPEDLTPEFTDKPQGPVGVSNAQYKVPILYQGRYTSEKYGSKIPGAGCGVTSLTMVLNYYNINNTPIQTADEVSGKYWNVAGDCCGWRGGMPGFKNILEKHGLKTKSVGGPCDMADVLPLLKYGPVIVSVTGNGKGRCPYTGGGHYVVITGYENGYVYTNDPNEGNKRRGTEKLALSEIQKTCKVNAGGIVAYK